MLCVHDVAGNGNVFGSFLDALADRHRPIAFDLPAHGRSGSLDSLRTIAEMAAYAKALPTAELTSPVLVGDGMERRSCRAAATWPDWPAAWSCGGASARRRRRAPRSSRCASAAAELQQFDTTGYEPDTEEIYQRRSASG